MVRGFSADLILASANQGRISLRFFLRMRHPVNAVNQEGNGEEVESVGRKQGNESQARVGESVSSKEMRNKPAMTKETQKLNDAGESDGPRPGEEGQAHLNGEQVSQEDGKKVSETKLDEEHAILEREHARALEKKASHGHNDDGNDSQEKVREVEMAPEQASQEQASEMEEKPTSQACGAQDSQTPVGEEQASHNLAGMTQELVMTGHKQDGEPPNLLEENGERRMSLGQAGEQQSSEDYPGEEVGHVKVRGADEEQGKASEEQTSQTQLRLEPTNEGMIQEQSPEERGEGYANEDQGPEDQVGERPAQPDQEQERQQQTGQKQTCDDETGAKQEWENQAPQEQPIEKPGCQSYAPEEQMRQEESDERQKSQDQVRTPQNEDQAGQDQAYGELTGEVQASQNQEDKERADNEQAVQEKSGEKQTRPETSEEHTRGEPSGEHTPPIQGEAGKEQHEQRVNRESTELSDDSPYEKRHEETVPSVQGMVSHMEDVQRVNDERPGHEQVGTTQPSQEGAGEEQPSQASQQLPSQEPLNRQVQEEAPSRASRPRLKETSEATEDAKQMLPSSSQTCVGDDQWDRSVRILEEREKFAGKTNSTNMESRTDVQGARRGAPHFSQSSPVAARADIQGVGREGQFSHSYPVAATVASRRIEKKPSGVGLTGRLSAKFSDKTEILSSKIMDG